MATNNENLLILNGEEYEFSIILSNSEKSWSMPKNYFLRLNITESVFNWETRGFLEYKNDFEQIERGKIKSNKKNSELFYYRMDGTDRINITLKPTFRDVESSSNGRKFKKLPISKNMFIEITAAIYDTEDLFPGVIQQKSKRIYFWDPVYNSAVEQTTSFSSGEYLLKNNNISPINLPDKDRAVEVGELLKFLIEVKLSGKTSKDSWSSGINRIIYTAPAMYTINDTLDYLWDAYVGIDGYPGIFGFNRFNNTFELRSYLDVFTGYPSYQKEVFTFPDSSTDVVPIGPARSIRDNTFSFGDFSMMNSYKHTKMAGMDSMKAINTKSINWYDPVSKTFKVSLSNNTVSVAKEKFKVLVSKLGLSRATPMFVLNNTKIQNRSIEHRYISGAYKSSGDVSSGLCNTLRGALFLNDCINFSALGLPCRTSGTFIEVVSNKDLQGAWEDRFLGTWFITDIVHNIESSTYTNDIVAIKPNATEGFTIPELV